MVQPVKVTNPFPVFLMLALAFVALLATGLVLATGADLVLPACALALVLAVVILWAITRGVEST